MFFSVVYLSVKLPTLESKEKNKNKKQLSFNRHHDVCNSIIIHTKNITIVYST